MQQFFSSLNWNHLQGCGQNDQYYTENFHLIKIAAQQSH